MLTIRFSVLLAVGVVCVGCGERPTTVETEVYTYAAPADIGDGLGGAEAGSVGLDAWLLQLMVRQIEEGRWPNIHSVLVYRSGNLVLEEYFSGIMRSDSMYRDFGRDTLHDMYSVSKSFTSAAVGLALESAAILSVDQEVRDFFPEYVDMGGSLASGELRVRHLLTMSAGLEWDELSTPYTDPANSHRQMRDAGDAIGFVFSRSQADPPGTVFVYNTGLSTILGEIVARATGENVTDYLASRLFDPLDVHEFDWLRGYYNGDLAFTGGGLQLRPRDMIKFGVLYLNEGVWQNRRIVRETWISESTAPQAPGGRYGYQWWVGTITVDARSLSFFRAAGLGGQHIFVLPSIQLVVAFTGNGAGSGPFELMEDYILAGIS